MNRRRLDHVGFSDWLGSYPGGSTRANDQKNTIKAKHAKTIMKE
jgi:hypothetical protein